MLPDDCETLSHAASQCTSAMSEVCAHTELSEYQSARAGFQDCATLASQKSACQAPFVRSHQFTTFGPGDFPDSVEPDRLKDVRAEILIGGDFADAFGHKRGVDGDLLPLQLGRIE